jgi:hypothetical protein
MRERSAAGLCRSRVRRRLGALEARGDLRQRGKLECGGAESNHEHSLRRELND